MATAAAAHNVVVTPRAPTPSPRVRARGSLPPGDRIASWRVDDVLGRGGMATVYAVTHQKFGKRAAIKLAHREILGDAFTADTFLREARIVRGIEHPGVVNVYASGARDDIPYLVMEKLAGASLGRMVDRAPIPRVQALRVLIELCDILRAAHRVGVVHRDLKLDNVILCDRPFAGGRRVKLVDWGVAYQLGEEDPFRGMIAGTLVYVAPEQVRGEDITPAADIYSLAVLAYHLLCRRPPFQSSSDLALIAMHLRTEPPPASLAWPTIPAELDALLTRMLSKRPEDRPALDEVERALREALDQLSPKSSLLASLQAVASAPPSADPFGRIALPVPPLRAGWVALALGIASLAALLHQLPL